MSEIVHGEYLEGAQVRLTHLPTGTALMTDPPPELGGDGTSFSPIDLLAGALSACVMTVVALVADRMELDLTGMRMEVSRAMAEGSKRVACIGVVLHLPPAVPEDKRGALARAAAHCPVRNSLHPDVQVAVDFRYDA